VIERLGIDSAYNTLAEGARINTSPSTMFQMFLLFRHFVATMDRRSFGMIGCEGQHYLRLSIATSMDDLKTAMDSLSEAVEDENGFRDYFAKQEPLY
ncbi:MAG: aspartate aminotransferase, partial [Candidatus Zixiibacteriota bacterium]